MTKSEQKYEGLKDRYIKAYLKSNGKNIGGLWFDSGWVYVLGNKFIAPTKVRVSQFEKMTESLEKRVNEQK